MLLLVLVFVLVCGIMSECITMNEYKVDRCDNCKIKSIIKCPKYFVGMYKCCRYYKDIDLGFISMADIFTAGMLECKLLGCA
jgi:hypothetical protein